MPSIEPIDDPSPSQGTSSAINASPSTSTSTPTVRIRTAPASSGDGQGKHRRTPSVVSPVDISASSPAARRMSRSHTPQSARAARDGLSLRGSGGVRGWAAWAGRNSSVVLAGVISVIVLVGTAYAELYSLAQNTSLLPTLPVLSTSTAYFARKNNPFNVYGVKLSWLHTSLAYLLHLFTAPPHAASPRLYTRSRPARLWKWLLTSLLWASFTSWLFGLGLGDRVIQASGGECVVAIPKEWGVDRSGIEAVLSHVPISVGAYLLPSSSTPLGEDSAVARAKSKSPSQDKTKRDPKAKANIRDPSYDPSPPSSLLNGAAADAVDDPNETLLLGLPHALCVSRVPLSPKIPAHRDVIAILSNLPFPLHVKAPGAAQLQLPRPRWFKGHDISGHTVVLTLAALLLLGEVRGTWARWVRGITGAFGDGSGQSVAPHSGHESGHARSVAVAALHNLAGVWASVVLAVWVWMIGVTAVYFHSPDEKISGLALGLGLSFLTYILTPSARRAAAITPTALQLDSAHAASSPLGPMKTSGGSGAPARLGLGADGEVETETETETEAEGAGAEARDENSARRGRVVLEAEAEASGAVASVDSKGKSKEKEEAT